MGETPVVVSMTEGLDAEIDEVGRADELDDCEGDDRFGDDEAHAEAYEGDGGEHAEGVAEHTQEAALAAKGERTSDHEEHARTGDDYERKRREGEGPDVSCDIILSSISHYGLAESVCLKSKKGW